MPQRLGRTITGRSAGQARQKRHPRRAVRKTSITFDSRGRGAFSLAASPLSKAAGAAEIPPDLSRIVHEEYHGPGGERIIHAQDYFRGFRVYRAGVVIKAAGATVSSTPTLYDVPSNTVTKAITRPVGALDAVISYFKKRRVVARSSRLRVVRESRFSELLGTPTVISSSTIFSEPVRLRLEVFGTPATHGAELAWVIQGALKSGLRFEAVVSARRRVPRILLCTSTNNRAAFSANVVRLPAEAAQRTQCPIAPITPGGFGVPSVWRTGGTRAEGPNATCHNGSNSKAETLGPAEADTPFYWCNVMRDFFRAFGFEGELYGFEGDDPIWTRRFSEPLELCAECLLDGDGHDIYIDFYDSPYAGGTHAAIDPSIVIHEYTHAVSNRLLGGASVTFPFFGIQGAGLEEGYSDYFALTVLDFLRRQNGTPPSSLIGAGFQPGGIRDYETVGKWRNALTDEYEIGKVWCAALLDARNALAQPLDVADRLMWQAVVLSLKSMTPICASGGYLTLAHAKDALMTSLSKFGASAPQLQSVANAFQGRNL